MYLFTLVVINLCINVFIFSVSILRKKAVFLFRRMTVFLASLLGERTRRGLPHTFPFAPANSIRQNLKEKHARHIADLRAYYESEILSLKQRLEAKETAAVEDWKKANQILVDR